MIILFLGTQVSAKIRRKMKCDTFVRLLSLSLPRHFWDDYDDEKC